MTDSEQETRIKNYAKLLNSRIEDGELLDFVTLEVLDRVLVYLNDNTLDQKLERIVARIVSGVFAESQESSDGELSHNISSISDNGQTISYSEKVKSYLVSTDDEELFSGFSKLLAPYRRVNVASE
ncbi:MAG: hypothetical protein IKB97_06990 [Bacteroidaceae bacterium]|jgi:hypothetical protein|nr:hypothetical protein [Candidatus Saccharibacteria bacterium]MBR2863285.1 hypothetical protein [Bacteroidaceae bacterium]